MFPALHNVPAHFRFYFILFIYFLTWGLWQCLFYSLFIHLLLKIHSSFPPCPSPKPHLDVDGEAGETVVPWWLCVPVGTSHGVSLLWGSLSPELFGWAWPLQNYPFKREIFLFQLWKKVTIHWIPMSAFCLNQWWVCGVDFSFKKKCKSVPGLLCLFFFLLLFPSVWWNNWRVCWNMTLKVRQAFSWHRRGLWCSCQNMAQVKGHGTLS